MLNICSLCCVPSVFIMNDVKLFLISYFNKGLFIFNSILDGIKFHYRIPVFLFLNFHEVTEMLCTPQSVKLLSFFVTLKSLC